MRLGDISIVQSGLTPRAGLEASSGGLLAIQLGDLQGDDSIDFARASRISDRGVSAHHIVGPGDVLFRSRGARMTSCFVGDELREPAAAVMPLFIIRPTSDVVDGRYLSWCLNQPTLQRYFAQGAAGTNLRMISKPVLQNALIDLPPIATQRSIARIAECAAHEHALSARLADLRYQLASLSLSEVALTSSDSITRERTPR
jgi:hypothetical protein